MRHMSAVPGTSNKPEQILRWTLEEDENDLNINCVREDGTRFTVAWFDGNSGKLLLLPLPEDDRKYLASRGLKLSNQGYVVSTKSID